MLKKVYLGMTSSLFEKIQELTYKYEALAKTFPVTSPIQDPQEIYKKFARELNEALGQRTPILKEARCCGLFYLFNEEEILKESLVFYLEQGIDLVVFDNESTDDSPRILEETRKENHPGRIIDKVLVKTNGYEWRKILKTACDYCQKNLRLYRWILNIDADAFYDSPIKGISLRAFIQMMDEEGANIIESTLYEFYPTEADNPSIKKATERLKYGCKEPFKTNQQKIFQHGAVDFYTLSGHVVGRENPEIATLPVIYRHYPWLSLEHGTKKIFKNRIPRYVERRQDPTEHPQYLSMLPIKEDLVKNTSNLKHFSLEQEQISLEEYRRKRTQLIHNARIISSNSNAYFKSKINHPGKRAETFSGQIDSSGKALQIPSSYIFLMTGKCNKACSFCNQIDKSPEEITESKMTVLLEHIPFISNRFQACLSGGGEPLLVADLHGILALLRQRNATITIRTNGSLLKERADVLQQFSLERLEISASSLDQLENLQLPQTVKNVSSRIALCFIVSRDNIESLPDAVRMAHSIGFTEISVSYELFFSEKQNINRSLFFDQENSNRKLLEACTLAREFSMRIDHEPLFGQAGSGRCTQPWRHMLIRWDGEVFPCCGGEVWLRKYHFGNLLKQHLSDFWNAPPYTRIRRTCLGENFIPECCDCHASMNIQGADFKGSHLLYDRTYQDNKSPLSGAI